MRRARSVSGVLAAGPVAPPAPAPDSEPWPLERVLGVCARAKADDILNLWWKLSPQQQASEDDDGVIFVPGPLTFWRGQVEAPGADGILAVRWPGGLPSGPAAGTYEFPGPALRDGTAVVIGMAFQRSHGAANVAGVAGPPRQVGRTESRPVLQAVPAHPAHQSFPRQSEFLVPLLAAAFDVSPSQQSTALTWQQTRLLIGEEVFDNAVFVVNQHWEDGDDEPEFVQDYVSAQVQHQFLDPLLLDPAIQAFILRINEVMAERNRPPIQMDYPHSASAQSPPAPLSGSEAILHLADILEGRSERKSTVMALRGLKIPTSIESPWSALYFMTWTPQQKAEWESTFAALLSLLPGFRTAALRKRFLTAQQSMMALWLASDVAGMPLSLDRVKVPKERFNICAEHLAEVVATLITASSGEERGAAAKALLQKQWHEGSLDIVHIFDQKQEDLAIAKKDPQAEELLALKKQVAELSRNQASRVPQVPSPQAPTTLVLGSGRGRGVSSFWRGSAFRGGGYARRGRGRGAW